MLGSSCEVIETNLVVLVIPFGPLQSGSEVRIVQISGQHRKGMEDDPWDELQDVLAPITDSSIGIVLADLDSFPTLGWQESLSEDEDSDAEQNQKAPYKETRHQPSWPLADPEGALETVVDDREQALWPIVSLASVAIRSLRATTTATSRSITMTAT